MLSGVPDEVKGYLNPEPRKHSNGDSPRKTLARGTDVEIFSNPYGAMEIDGPSLTAAPARRICRASWRDATFTGF